MPQFREKGSVGVVGGASGDVGGFRERREREREVKLDA